MDCHLFHPGCPEAHYEESLLVLGTIEFLLLTPPPSRYGLEVYIPYCRVLVRSFMMVLAVSLLGSFTALYQLLSVILIKA
jgi:hypothetical protein